MSDNRQLATMSSSMTMMEYVISIPTPIISTCMRSLAVDFVRSNRNDRSSLSVYPVWALSTAIYCGKRIDSARQFIGKIVKRVENCQYLHRLIFFSLSSYVLLYSFFLPFFCVCPEKISTSINYSLRWDCP